MKKVDSLLRREVTILGANGLFGKITSLLLKQSPCVNVLNLFDYEKVQTGGDLETIKSNCKVRCHSGKDSIGFALKTADIIVISDYISKGFSFFNAQAEFLYKAPKIANYAAKIAGCNSTAVIVIATSPINFTLPLMNGVLDKLGKLDVGKVLGMTNVDIIRANSLFASHLHVSPKNVWLPVVGGSSQETRVPLFSKARPSQTMNMAMWQKITSEIKKFDLQIYGAKHETEMVNRAHATAQLICAIMAGLEGRKGVVETVMSQQKLVKGASFFSLPVLLGKDGIQKRISLPSVTGYESNLLSYAIKSLASDANKAVEYLRTNVNIEELKVTSRINKLNDLEVSSRMDSELKGDNDIIHKIPKMKEKCPLNIRYIFTKNAEVESPNQKFVMKDEKMAAQSKVSHKPLTPKDEECSANLLKTMIVEEDAGLLHTTDPSSDVITIKTNENSMKISSFHDETLESKSKEVEIPTSAFKSGQDVLKPDEGFDVDKVLDTIYPMEETLLTQSKSISRKSIKDNIKPVIVSAVSNEWSGINELNKGSMSNETNNNIGNTISFGNQDASSPVVTENQTPKLKSSLGGEKKKCNIDSELPQILKQESCHQKKTTLTGRIPPPQSIIRENKAMIHKPSRPINNLEDSIRDNKDHQFIHNNENTIRTNEADEFSDLLKNSKKANLNKSLLDADNKELCSFKNHKDRLETCSKDQESPFVRFREISEDSVKERTAEYVILYPTTSKNKETETEIHDKSGADNTIKKEETKKICQQQSSSDQDNKDSKTFQSKSIISNGNNRLLPVLKEDLDGSSKTLDSNERNINLPEIKDTTKTNINCRNTSFDKKQELYSCISTTTSTDGFRINLPKCARFASSELLNKEANDLTDNVDKKKYKPQAEQIWKFFKDKRTFITNDNLITQEGPAATLLKKKNSPLTNVKLAHELRHVNNDETSLTRKLQEKQKKLIMSLRNNNVSFDKEKAESPLSIKTNSDNFKIKSNVHPPNFRNSSDSKYHEKSKLQTIQEFSKIIVSLNEETVKNKEEIKKTKNLPSDNNFPDELEQVQAAQKCNKELKRATSFEYEVDKRNCSVEKKTGTTSQCIQHSDADLKQNSNEGENNSTNRSTLKIARNTPDSQNNPDPNTTGESEHKIELQIATPNPDLEINKFLPATVLESSQCNKEDEHCLNDSNSNLHEQGNIKNDKALVIVNVSSGNCESSKIKF